MKSLILVRCAAHQRTRDGDGRLVESLTATGEDQTRQFADTLAADNAQPPAIHVSPWPRALLTGRVIARGWTQLPQVFVEEDLQPLRIRVHADGAPQETLRRARGQVEARGWSEEALEEPAAFERRVLDFVRGVLDSTIAETVIVVSHSDVLRSMRNQLGVLADDLTPGSVRVLDVARSGLVQSVSSC